MSYTHPIFFLIHSIYISFLYTSEFFFPCILFSFPLHFPIVSPLPSCFRITFPSPITFPTPFFPISLYLHFRILFPLPLHLRISFPLPLHFRILFTSPFTFPNLFPISLCIPESFSLSLHKCICTCYLRSSPAGETSNHLPPRRGRVVSPPGNPKSYHVHKGRETPISIGEPTSYPITQIGYLAM